jgi:hypothetical protein
MGKHPHPLKTLRTIALEHGTTGQPDLASMALELGRVVHRDVSALASGPATLSGQQHGLQRWLLAERSKPAINVLVMASPASQRTPVHDHAGLWGLEMTPVGALEVESFTREPVSGDLHVHGRDWLGPGDGTWLEGAQHHVHRCRNLSKQATALTLHVYGGELAEYFGYEQVEPAGPWLARPQRSAVSGRLPY